MSNEEPDLSWLPTFEEWDFRGLTAEECGLACRWEYARSVPSIRDDPFEWADTGKGYDTTLAWILWYAFRYEGAVFPAPWLSWKEEARSAAARADAELVRIKPISEFLKEFERMRRLKKDPSRLKSASEKS